MKDRVYKIAFEYLAQTEEEPKKVDEEAENALPEAKVREIAKETLARNYSILLGSFFRNMDIVQLLSAADFASKQFSPTGIPRQQLSNSLTSMKSKALISLKDVALLDRSSIIDQIVAESKKNLDATEDDIAEYVRDFLVTLKADTRSYIRRINQLAI